MIPASSMSAGIQASSDGGRSLRQDARDLEVEIEAGTLGGAAELDQVDHRPAVFLAQDETGAPHALVARAGGAERQDHGLRDLVALEGDALGVVSTSVTIAWSAAASGRWSGFGRLLILPPRPGCARSPCPTGGSAD